MPQSKLYPELNLQQTTSNNRVLGLWRLLTGFRWTYIGAALSLAVAAGTKAYSYVLLRDFADNALESNGGTTPLYYFALAFVGLAILEAGFTFFHGKLVARAAEGVILRLRNFIFDHLQRLPFKYHDHMQTGELIQRVSSDIDAVRRFFADQGSQIGRIITLFVINLVTLLALNARLALLSLIFVPLVLIISFWFFKKITVLYNNYQDQDGHLSATLQENLSGVRVVRAFARQTYEIDKFERDNLSKFKQGKRLLLMHALYWPMTDVICFSQILGIFYLGGQMTISGEITIGTYMAFVNIIGWLVWPIRNLGRIVAEGSKALVSYRRVADIIDEQQEVVNEGIHIPFNKNGLAEIQAEVVFDKVSFAYEADKPVLDEITFAAKPGQTIALLGSTGSGKSSLVNLLPRFYHYTSGSLTLDGVELRDYAVHDLRRIIGTVEQEPFLFSRTIRENIAYGVNRTVTNDEIEQAAKTAAVHEVIMTFPNGYDTLVGEKGVTLSGGQKQRLAIARTLLKNPRILILDDSTSSVDTETESLIRDALDKLMKGRTTFVIAHRIQTVMNADLILVLDKGHIVQQGQHEDLVNQPGLYRDIYDIQAKIETQVEAVSTVADRTNEEDNHVGLRI